ncbi:MAG: glycosyltransferase family 2 protein [Gammaproteobacteria bacterium]|nr:glycosyltransferase family 2 protein [Gammaproteobacteria bacterium]
MLEILFWLSAGVLVYIYAGYPLVLLVATRFSKKTVAKGSFTPTVSIIIPAFNEAAVIAETIENKLALDYPEGKLEIIVVSDESTDGTDEIVEKYSARGVKLIRQEPRQGKTSGLNLAVPEASGEIIVFSDANSIYGHDALLRLTSNFADETVGYVTGKMIYVSADGSVVGDGCSAYMKYENYIRSMESALNSVVGVDGGVDAVRSSLYQQMRADQLPDFVLPLSVASKKYRVVYEPAAILKEQSLSDADSEYRMRVRVALRAMWALLDMCHLLNPFRYPVYSWQLLSHKILRYMAFLPLIALFVSNAMLLGQAPYGLLFAGQIIFYCLAGFCLYSSKDDMPFYFSLPYYFVLLNVSCANAFWRFIRGQKQIIWNPRLG